MGLLISCVSSVQWIGGKLKGVTCIRLTVSLCPHITNNLVIGELDKSKSKVSQTNVLLHNILVTSYYNPKLWCLVAAAAEAGLTVVCSLAGGHGGAATGLGAA